MELGIEAFRPARVDAHKMVPSRSLAVRKMYVKQFVRGIQHQGSPTVPLLHPVCSQRSPTRRDDFSDPMIRQEDSVIRSSSCDEGKPAVKLCSYRPSPSYVLYRVRVSLTPHSCLPPDLSLSHISPNTRSTSEAWLARTKPREGGASCPFSTPASLLTSRPSIISLRGVTSPAVTLGGGASSYLVIACWHPVFEW